jgi:hypothetical protein
MLPRLSNLAVLLMMAIPLSAQQQSGELRLRVVDSTDAPLLISGELVGEATQVRRQFSTDADGLQTLTALPFGVYRLRIAREGFQPSTSLIEIRSELPLTYRVVLGVLPIQTEADVSDTATLLNPDRTGASQQIGSSTLRDRPASTPARAIIDLVNAQPGWLLEANGVLHPRGSEYGVQYVFDGLPLLDNRSPNFAPSPDIDQVQSMIVRTGRLSRRIWAATGRRDRSDQRARRGSGPAWKSHCGRREFRGFERLDRSAIPGGHGHLRPQI